MNKKLIKEVKQEEEKGYKERFTKEYCQNMKINK